MKPDYEKGIGPDTPRDTVMVFPRLGGKGPLLVPVTSGGLTCNKCGREIPPKEMFCADCFGQEAPKRPRVVKPKPDDGDLLKGVFPMKL